MTLDLKAIRRAIELQEKASPAEWWYDGYSTIFSGCGDIPREAAIVPRVAGDTATPQGRHDAAFIAHAHTTADQLRAAVKLLQVAREALDGLLNNPRHVLGEEENCPRCKFNEKARAALLAIPEDLP